MHGDFLLGQWQDLNCGHHIPPRFVHDVHPLGLRQTSAHLLLAQNSSLVFWQSGVQYLVKDSSICADSFVMVLKTSFFLMPRRAKEVSARHDSALYTVSQQPLKASRFESHILDPSSSADPSFSIVARHCSFDPPMRAHPTGLPANRLTVSTGGGTNICSR